MTLAEHDSDIKKKARLVQKKIPQSLCVYFAQISGERLQDHWSSGLLLDPIRIYISH